MPDVLLAHLIAFQAGRFRWSRRIPFARGDHAEIEDRPVSLRERAIQLTRSIELITQIDHVALFDHGCKVIGLNGIWEDIGLPRRARRRVHAAHLLFDDLGNLGLGGQFDLALSVGYQLKLLCRDFSETERFDPVWEEVRFAATAIGIDRGNQFTLTILQGVEFAARLAMDYQCACRERLAMLEREHPAALVFL